MTEPGEGAVGPERSVTIAAIVFFLKAVGFIVVIFLALGDTLSVGARLVPVLLGAGSIGAGVGLLLWKRWGWLLALCVLIVDAALVGGIFRMLIDLGLLLLLVRPQVRARFGMAEPARRSGERPGPGRPGPAPHRRKEAQDQGAD